MRTVSLMEIAVPLAKLSERFYQKFGHDLVEELIGWLNEMDATHRGDLRELNELNFARFDAKLDQRASELDARIDSVAARLDAKIDQRVAELRGELKAGLEAQTSILVKWMLGIWVAAIPTLAGVIELVERFLPPHR